MRIVVVGVLGEVGGAVADALATRGHEIRHVTTRRDAAHGRVLWIGDEGVFDGVHLVVNASGPGDHRKERDWRAAGDAVMDAVAAISTPKVLLSTIRVLEGAGSDFDEDAPAQPSTHYGQSNAQLESQWLAEAGDDARVLRLMNIITVPTYRGSPQERLLPWSLALEGLDSGAIGVRSGRHQGRSFVDADDIARALELLALSQGPPVIASAPGAWFSLGELAEAVRSAFVDAELPAPPVTFGSDVAHPPRCRTGWLAAQGWTTTLSLDVVRARVAQWLAQRATMAS